MSLVDKNTCIIEFKPPAPTCKCMVHGQHVPYVYFCIFHIFLSMSIYELAGV